MEYDMLRTMLTVSFMSFAFERGSECILFALFGLCLLGLVTLYFSLPFSSYFLWIFYSHSIRPVRHGSSRSFLILTRLIIMLWNSI